MIKHLIPTILMALWLALLATPASAQDRLFDISSVDLGTMSEGGKAEFEIELRNITNSPLNITEVETTCGCTVANAPSEAIEPGSSASLKVTIDTRGKIGDISKQLTITTTQDGKRHQLTLNGRVEHFGDVMPDPSVIFKGECASCHVGQNVQSKQGADLYNSLCFFCHKDGLTRTTALSADLPGIIANGLPGTSMPGFLNTSGGPLSAEQLQGLKTYITGRFGKEQ